ncbi:MAG TPA: diguanylate cyclase [Buttiauxella sp.]|jgi:diguanylate cyclase (GGDEF)-like protein
MTLNVDDIDYSLSELNRAIKDHYDWAGKLLQLSLLRGKADEDIMDVKSHQHCRFSHWLKQRLEGETLDVEMVMNIDKYHTAMHDIARRLMQSIISETTTEQLVVDYHSAQRLLINSLDSYKEYLFSWRNLHDSLTGLPLRHLLYQEFPYIRAHCSRAARQLYVLIVDIDRFKIVNDTWGHNAGDDVLHSVAQTLKSATRKTERIYRFGGEEFVILLEAKHDEDAQKAAERLRKHLEVNDIDIDGQTIRVTVTGGLTKVAQEDSLHGAIGRADKAMYFGKSTGRNRCIMSTADEDMLTL